MRSEKWLDDELGPPPDRLQVAAMMLAGILLSLGGALGLVFGGRVFRRIDMGLCVPLCEWAYERGFRMRRIQSRGEA